MASIDAAGHHAPSEGGYMGAHNAVQVEIHSLPACIVTLHGEHDIASIETVSLALVAARRYPLVLVDLSRCAFLDASLINTLLAASKRARHRGGTLELVVPVEPNAVRRTLELANVQANLPFHATRATALGSLAAKRRPHREPGIKSAPAGAMRKLRIERAPSATVLRAEVIHEYELPYVSAVRGARGRRSA
jgi:anti-anti-sigma factor